MTTSVRRSRPPEPRSLASRTASVPDGQVDVPIRRLPVSGNGAAAYDLTMTDAFGSKGFDRIAREKR
jgi:hypothetical protein